ncbi:MAG: hypothetical protein R2720_00080 [Candidatus Nanopelagicales bacterium]
MVAVPDRLKAAVTAYATRGAFRLHPALPNTETFRGSDTGTCGELFARRDVCVSDGISMLIEFQIARKSVVYVAREGHRPFNDLGQVPSAASTR